MTQVLHAVTLILLFLLIYIALKYTMTGFIHIIRRRTRLRQHPMALRKREERRFHHSLPKGAQFEVNVLYEHLSNVLESVRSKMKMRHFLTLSLILLLLGLWGGLIAFETVKGMLICGCIAVSAPYLWLRIKLLNMQMNSRLEFLPAVEVFYQLYVLAEGKNFRNTLKLSIQENRIRYPIKPVFEQLYRNLTTNRGTEQSVHLFAMSLGHVWARYFANMVFVAITEGADISANIHELIMDMRKAQRASQSERNKLLEIRIASFSPLLFLVIFIAINLRLNYEQAYYYYFIDPAGRNMLLEALALIFASFVMGFYLSHRKM